MHIPLTRYSWNDIRNAHGSGRKAMYRTIITKHNLRQTVPKASSPSQMRYRLRNHNLVIIPVAKYMTYAIIRQHMHCDIFAHIKGCIC